MKISVERQRQIGRPHPGVAVKDMTQPQFKEWAEWFNAAAQRLHRKRLGF